MPPIRHRRFQFSLRTLFIVITCVALATGFYRIHSLRKAAWLEHQALMDRIDLYDLVTEADPNVESVFGGGGSSSGSYAHVITSHCVFELQGAEISPSELVNTIAKRLEKLLKNSKATDLAKENRLDENERLRHSHGADYKPPTGVDTSELKIQFHYKGTDGLIRMRAIRLEDDEEGRNIIHFHGDVSMSR